MVNDRSKLLLAALDCMHEIEDNRITLYFDDSKPGHNVTNQLGNRLEAAAPPPAVAITDDQIAVLADDFRSTYAYCQTLHDEFDALGFARELLASTQPSAAGAAEQADKP